MCPIGHAAQIHIDLASRNFGIREWSGIEEPLYEVFDGIPEITDGYAYVNNKPGFGVEFNEEAAKNILIKRKSGSGHNTVCRTVQCSGRRKIEYIRQVNLKNQYD